MSYILDALKKSEKERRRGTVPDMLTVQDITSEKPAKRFHWGYLLVAALILNAGILMWWFGFAQNRNGDKKEAAISAGIEDAELITNGRQQFVNC